MKKSGSKPVESASQLVDLRIESLGDWRGEMLARIRALIKQADPEVLEECKWVKPSNPWECLSGRTAASSAPERPTRMSSR